MSNHIMRMKEEKTPSIVKHTFFLLSFNHPYSAQSYLFEHCYVGLLKMDNTNRAGAIFETENCKAVITSYEYERSCASIDRH